jgi:hypothetical protein
MNVLEWKALLGAGHLYLLIRYGKRNMIILDLMISIFGL